MIPTAGRRRFSCYASGLGFVLLTAALPATSVAGETTVDAIVERELPGLLGTYKELHAAPELSHHEVKTAALVARDLRALGYTVTEHIGRYPQADQKGHGVVGVLVNGTGPTVLVRADMDALPLVEKTGLPWASTVRTKDDAGQDVGVMHACGHDMHVTTLLGTARVLAQLRSTWAGTVVLVAQPAEETIDGARALLADGLYERVPKPGSAVALHVTSQLATGTVGVVSGFALASSTSVDITVRGVGGHGSRPEVTRDPVVLAAQLVLALQTIVSREVSAFDPVVVTVGAIHGGTKRNIIPDDVTLKLTVRTYKDEVRKRVIASIERIARGTALAAGLPDDRLPVVTVLDTESTSATYNDPALTERLAGAMRRALGPDGVVAYRPIMGSEDFGNYGLADRSIPTSLVWLGASDPARLAEAERTGVPVPGQHSALFTPVPEPTLRTGVRALSAGVLELLRSGAR